MKLCFSKNGKNENIIADAHIDYDNFILIIQYSKKLPIYFDSIFLSDRNNNKITLINCSLVKSKKENVFIFKYKFSSYIDNWVDLELFRIKSIEAYYKEISSVIIDRKIRFSNESIIIDKSINKIDIYSNDNVSIEISERPEIDIQDSSRFIYSNKYSVCVVYNESFVYKRIYERLREIENIFGFAIGYNLNLLELHVVDSFNKRYRVVNEIISKDDTNTRILPKIDDIGIIRKIVKRYFEDDYIKPVINNYYDCINKNLNPTLEFVSNCNAFEIIANEKIYKDKIDEFISKNFKNKKDELLEYEKILNKLEKDDAEFIKNKCNLNYVSLTHKICYFLVEKVNDRFDDKISSFSSKISATRNHYVHGSKRRNVFMYDELRDISTILNELLFVLTIEICEASWIYTNYYKDHIKELLAKYCYSNNEIELLYDISVND